MDWVSRGRLPDQQNTGPLKRFLIEGKFERADGRSQLRSDCGHRGQTVPQLKLCATSVACLSADCSSDAAICGSQNGAAARSGKEPSLHVEGPSNRARETRKNEEGHNVLQSESLFCHRLTVCYRL